MPYQACTARCLCGKMWSTVSFTLTLDLCGVYLNSSIEERDSIWGAAVLVTIVIADGAKSKFKYTMAVCEIMFAEVIDHWSRVKNIHHRWTVYTCRLVMLSSSKTHEVTRLDNLPSPTQFLPRSGPRSMGNVAHCNGDRHDVHGEHGHGLSVIQCGAAASALC